VFSTAHYGHEEIEPMLRAYGVQDVIFKPAQPTTVLATIDALLGGPAVAPQPDAGSVADHLAETQQVTRSGTWELDPEQGLIVVSAGLRDLLRLPDIRVRPELLRERVHPDDIGTVTTMIGNTWRTGLPNVGEVRIAGMDGVVHELIVSCRTSEPGRPGTEPIRTMWGVAQDVTAVRRAERARLREQAAWQAERRAVDSVHRAVLPLTLPRAAGVDLGATYLAARERLDVGSGWYDAQLVSGGRILLSVGKVAGHDLPAVAVTAPILAALRAYAFEDPDPARLLTRLNRFLAESLQDDTFVTSVVASYDPETNYLRVANAGHPAPLVITPREHDAPLVTSLSHCGPALGIFPETEFTGYDLALAPGALLCAYTDGLIGRSSADEQRLPQAAVRALRNQQCLPTAQDLAERVVGDLLCGDPLDDDVCLAVLWATGP
jgi:hypothetical protein